MSSSLIGFSGETVYIRGMIALSIIVGQAPRQETILLNFLVVKVPLAYNVIFGRLGLNASMPLSQPTIYS